MRLGALDGLRGFAAILVMVTHLNAANTLYLMSWAHHAQSLLTVFFIFSGFVVALTYGDRIQDARDAARFGVKRFGRIYPLHFVALFAVLAMECGRALANGLGLIQSEYAPFTGRTSIMGFFENLFLTQSWGWEKLNTWNGPSWTLSTEIVAYALVAAIALVFKTVRGRIIAGIAAMCVAAAFYADFSGFFTDTRTPSIARCIMDFYVGYLIFYVWKRWPLKSRVFGTVLEAGTIATAFVLAHVAAQGWLYLSNTLIFAAMLWAFASGRGLLSAFFSVKPMVWLGSISLAIYLVHYPLLMLLDFAVRFAELALGISLRTEMIVPGGEVMRVISFAPVWVMNIFSVAVFAACVFVGSAAHKWVEAPARAYFAALADRKFGGRAQPQAAGEQSAAQG